MSKISVVINTLNSEKTISRVIKSVKWADEIIICDMYSTDRTKELAKKLGAKVYLHKKNVYVEPVRNFAISKAINEWVLVLDPDELVTNILGQRLKEISSKMKQVDYVRLPRKNIIFGKWMKASGWWPDYNVRFFKKGKVSWTNKIHRPPNTSGMGLDIPAEDKWAIIHHHYSSITQFMERMLRYTKVQADELVRQGYQFDWKDLIKKPLGEFLGRFFANHGYQDGLHGLSLSLLQAFSFLVVYLRIWEVKGFKEENIDLGEFKEINDKSSQEVDYWFENANLPKNVFKRFIQKIKYKL